MPTNPQKSSLDTSMQANLPQEQSSKIKSAVTAGERTQGGQHHPSFIPNPVHRESPDQGIPGAYPETGKSSDEDHAFHSKNPVEGHEGHDHRPMFKVDLPLHEQPSGSREGVGSLPGPNNAAGVAILPDERKQMSHKRKSSGKGSKHHALVATQEAELPSSETPSGSTVGVGSMPGNMAAGGEKGNGVSNTSMNEPGTLEALNPIPAPCKAKTLTTSMDDYEPLKDLNPIPPPSHEHAPNPQAPANPKLEGYAPPKDLCPIPPPSHEHDPKSQLSAQPTEDKNVTTPTTGHHPAEKARNIAIHVEHAAEDVVGAVEGYASEVFHGAGALLHNIGAHWGGGESEQAEDLAKRDPNTATGHSFLTTGSNAPHSKSPKPSDTTDKQPGQQEEPPKAVYHERTRVYEYDLHGDCLDTDQFLYEDDVSVEGDVAAAHALLRRKQAGKDTSSLPPSSVRGEDTEGDGTAVGYGGVEYYTEGKGDILPGYPTPKGMGILIADRLNDDRMRAQEANNNTKQDSPSNRAQFLRGESTVSNRAADGSYSSVSTADMFATDLSEHQIIEEKREVPVFQDGTSSAAGKYEAIFEPVQDSGGDLGDRQFTGGQVQAFQPHEVSIPIGRHYTTTETQNSSSQPSSSFSSRPMDRHFEEKREVPVFLDGSETAAGKFEAMFEPVTGYPEEVQQRQPVSDQSQAQQLPELKHQTGSTAAGGFESTMSPNVPSPKPTPEVHGSASYLGKPVSKAEENAQIEKARLLAQQKAGKN